MRNTPTPTIASVPALIRHGWQANRALTGFILINITLAAIGIVAMLIDPRTLNGQNVWTKPVKFGFSNAIYAGTILLLLGGVQPRPRWVNWFFNLTSATLVPGMIVVTLQAARGVRSHYNFSTPFDATALSVMGLSTLSLSLISLIACVLLVRQPLHQSGASRSVVWGIKLGVVVTILVGFSVGSLMLLPSESQMDKMRTGAADAGTLIGAHTIGAEDGGPGLPFLGWSTTDGDLRPAHFFGLHALQIVPLLGLFVARRPEQWLGQTHRRSLVVIGALSYTGFIGLITWQALRAEPLLAPSATTLVAAAGLVVATAVATGLTLLHARRQLTRLS